MRLTTIFWLFIVMLTSCVGGEQQGEQVVNVYTHRHYPVDKEIYADFEKETGIKVNVIKASADELINRLAAEGEQSPADLFITVDGGRLWQAKTKDVLQPITSEKLEKQVGSNFKDKENYWYGLSYRSRVIVYNKELIDPSALTSYYDLADTALFGKVVVRSSENRYNQSLLASMIAHDGMDKAKVWTKAVRENMARDPKGNDTDQIKAVANGEAVATLVNNYYLARIARSEEEGDKEIASKVGIVFPEQDGSGSHVNISGAALAKHSPNKKNALLLLEYLTAPAAQTKYTEANNEYPVNPAVAPNTLLQEWGSFKADTLNMELLGEFNDEAVAVFNAAGWE